MMQHNNTANTHRSLHALAIISHQHKMGGGGGCPLIRVCSLITSNTVIVIKYLKMQVNNFISYNYYFRIHFRAGIELCKRYFNLVILLVSR